jgi:hypothetical protein
MDNHRITGTFLDEITVDIGSQNWGEDDWKRDFEAMDFIGIDTVIIIRGTNRDMCVFPSKHTGNTGDPDLAKLFLDLAAQHHMRLYFGTNDRFIVTPGFYNGKGVADSHVDEEIAITREFIDEVLSRYGGHPALAGWYITHEVPANLPGVSALLKGIAEYMKQVTPSYPVLMSPFFPTKWVLNENGMTPDEFKESWRELCKNLDGMVDTMFFQDGTCAPYEFTNYLAAAKEFCDEAGIELWNNTETFDRLQSYRFPPRDMRTLKSRLDMATPYVSKQVTFEFSHFMSPNSCLPGAANLYRRYCETVLGKKSPF